jgi:hypothetical protein
LRNCWRANDFATNVARQKRGRLRTDAIAVLLACPQISYECGELKRGKLRTEAIEMLLATTTKLRMWCAKTGQTSHRTIAMLLASKVRKLTWRAADLLLPWRSKVARFAATSRISF